MSGKAKNGLGTLSNHKTLFVFRNGIKLPTPTKSGSYKVAN